MKIIEMSFAIGVVSLLLFVGCGDPNTSTGSGTGSGEDLSHLTPSDICKQRCDLQVAAGCAKTPTDYATSCALLCEAKYQKFPNCAAQANALDACAIQRVTYGCEADVLTVMPEGACGSPALACASCTGDVLQCL